MSQVLKGIGGHTKPNKGTDVIWLTPMAILANLGIFDLDPCAAPSPRPWPTALEHIELPVDGLVSAWHGRVWLNPPYDEYLSQWMERMAKHRNGIALTFARTETAIWQKWIWPYAHTILFLAGRIYFRLPDGSILQKGSGKTLAEHDQIRGCPDVDVLSGGFPCQDISNAGRRAGLEGERSGLWRKMLRAIRLVRPKITIVENVAALLERGMGRVLGDLAESGLNAEWDCIPASSICAPHQRDRIFLAAYSGSESGGIIVDRKDDFPRNEEWNATKNIRTGDGWKRWLGEVSQAVDREKTYAWFRGMDDGLPGELDAMVHLGNAVVPQIAEWIAIRILAAEEETKARARLQCF